MPRRAAPGRRSLLGGVQGVLLDAGAAVLERVVREIPASIPAFAVILSLAFRVALEAMRTEWPDSTGLRKGAWTRRN